MTRLYSWGDSSNGQFSAQNAFAPALWSFPEDIIKICCGAKHTLFLNREGRLLSCRNNAKGQLGRRDNGQDLARVDGLWSESIVTIACGQYHCLAVCEEGDVYAWGTGGEGQLGIDPADMQYKQEAARKVLLDPFLPTPVVQVACGNNHSVALTKGGDVLSWGWNSHGQLGLGKDVSKQPVPALVPSLNGIAVAQISAGRSHTLMLTLSGLVYCCGANEAGQLGLNRLDPKGRFNICAVPALRPLGVSVIRCGAAHSAVLTKDGQVFTFGQGNLGQLGHGSTSNELGPRQVQGIDTQAMQIACGSQHTLVLGSSGHVWAFGHGVKGQCGTGGPQDCLTPTLVQLPWTTDRTAHIPNNLKIAAGWNSSFTYNSPSLIFDLEKTYGRLKDTRLQLWLSAKKCSREIEREIGVMFKTSSSLVGCFTKDCTPPPAADALTVDIEAASETFDKLTKIPWFRPMKLFDSMIDHMIMSRHALKSPEIFVVLLTCPFLQEEKSVMTCVVPLAILINEMNEKALATLRGWWGSLPRSIMTKHILVFRKALAFMLKNNHLFTHNRLVKCLLNVLRLLYKANNKANQSEKVPVSIFYLEELIGHVNPAEDVGLWIEWRHLSEDEEQAPAIFCRYPFVFNLVCKVGVFNLVALIMKNVHRVIHDLALMWPTVMQEAPLSTSPAAVFHLKLRRPHLVEDTFRQLASADDCAFQRELVVQFVEDMNLTDVNKRDFFFHVFEELMDPDSQMFMYNDRQTLAWFPAEPRVEIKSYFLFGVLCGMAVYNHNIVHLPFPLAFFKKLVNIKPSLEDMKEFEPVTAESLRHILEEYTSDDVENLDLDFTIHWDGKKVDLGKGESPKMVTSSNKKEFVDAFIKYCFTTSVEGVFEEFKRGFYKVCDRDVVDFFQPEELRGVMGGLENYDWEVFKKNTVYDGGYDAMHPSIVTFWEVFHEMTADQKKKFLCCERVPILGMQTITMTISPLPDSTELHYPESLTCHSLLLLPKYERYPAKKTLCSRLITAINHRRGFWEEGEV